MGHHTDRMESQGVGEDERPAVRIRKKRRKHGAVETRQLFTNVPGGLPLLEDRMKRQIVVSDAPRDTQRMGGQHDQTDRLAGEGKHFGCVAESQPGIAGFQQRGPGKQVVSDRTEPFRLVVMDLTDAASADAEPLRHLPARRASTVPLRPGGAFERHEFRCTSPFARGAHLDAPLSDLAGSNDPLFFYFPDQGRTKNAETPVSRAGGDPEQHEPLRIDRSAQVVRDGRNAIPVVELDESFAERPHFRTDAGGWRIGKLSEANDEIFGILRIDGFLSDHGDPHLGGNDGVFVQRGKVVVAEPALLFPPRRVTHFTRRDLLVHVRQHYGTVIDGMLVENRSSAPSDLQPGIVAGVLRCRLQNQSRRRRIVLAVCDRPFHQSRPLDDLPVRVAPRNQIDGLNVARVLDP